MAANETELYRFLNDSVGDFKPKGKLAKPDPTVDGEIPRIFKQAYDHRNLLVYFYIVYTIGFTVFVLALIGVQAVLRVRWHDPDFEVVPLGALNLLLTGMFAQFIGLLTIVTKRVWDYKPFFAYHNKMKGISSPDDTKDPED
ncbi:MAG: hypothetical protein AAB436_02250 [Patescibacteria group bacterium]